MAAVTAAAPYAARDRDLHNRALVRGWLYVVLLMLFVLVVVGGATRLTESGLSITEWQPIHGVIPPLNDAEWQEEFLRYQQIPQYAELNKGMSIEAFKSIFWWEWAHRILARVIGFVFALPLIFFWATRRIEGGLGRKLVGILLLLGLQAAIGWWMVASGLVDRVSVSQYRLATHLTIAALIFTATMVVARGLAPHSEPAADRSTQRLAGFIVLLALIQIYLGGLVAGLDAGLSYNTWPLMDGKVIPSDLLLLEPAWRNFFENPKTVQFVHRLGAYTLFIVALWHMIATWRRRRGTTHARRGALLFLLVLAQASIGIGTLLMQVPLHLALTHQGFALIVLGFAAAHWRGTKGAYPLPHEVKIGS
ncbi:MULTISPECIES: COX15/CtaA family protein [unclassified Mesorhizobium]|uniref:COX15/CtaA family protein n=1 Tax=unclassified Mesorhizobium TaxID=325217 RepID=UPI000BAF3B67|nr:MULTISPECIES: COX15/CtaA family protein [unclassified Mesorhizobium]AZO08290.1 heme A synthase [Mesorhizobium sp. M3A.F.Ca.ET.080.04.2.1]PBB85617.1 heme A synthase [Mesorhizobium sp. WSM3876]RWB72291.1 MAG: heme A synthase [Mesorhizobium sp.]RWB89307.1 MAG: heme A synthase [Mesorhizobium sp.]RWE24847.1 MAG: heme A synthase [Mesorhizobium sp.]